MAKKKDFVGNFLFETPTGRIRTVANKKDKKRGWRFIGRFQTYPKGLGYYKNNRKVR